MFSERFKKERKKLGLTQEQIANKLNISRSNVANWENGSNMASPDMIVKCAELFRCSVDYLLGKSDYKNFAEELDDKYHDKLPQLRNETKIFADLDKKINIKGKNENFEMLIKKLYEMDLINNTKDLSDEELNVILDFVGSNKNILKILLNK